jgi:osmotically-inducible protein OsmY
MGQEIDAGFTPFPSRIQDANEEGPVNFRDKLERGVTLAIGIAYGAGMMYMLDPDKGMSRRARIRDKMVGIRNEARWQFGRRMRYLLHRAQGAVAETRARVRGEQVSDEVLEARVRAQIGHVVSHPGLIEVHCGDGHVTLRGVVLPGEQERIEKRLSSTRGVHDWNLQLRTEKDIDAAAGRQAQYRQRVG